MKDTIREGCDSYLEDVVPDDAGSIQIKETEQAFYAGAHFTTSKLQGSKDAYSDFLKLRDEIEDWFKGIKNDSTRA